MTVAGRNVMKGLKEFRRFLNQERASLAATPVLLLDSDPSSSTTGNSSSRREDQQPSELLKQVQLLCTSVGLRTATSRPSSDHFPFQADVPNTLEFAKRIGASSVIGVGGSGAMELAKSVSSEMEQLFLVPGTCAATLFASSSSHALLLDPEDSAMVPGPAAINTPSLLILPEKVIAAQDPAVVRSALYAGLVFSLDALSRDTKNSQQALAQVEMAANLLDQWKDGEQTTNAELESNLQELMMVAGSSMAFGLEDKALRSVPLALASSLVPTTFPDYHFLGFVSCLFPGMVAMLQDHPEHGEMAMSLYHKLSSSCPRLVQSVGDDMRLNALMAQVHSDGARWNCMDVDDRVLEKVLDASLDL